MHQELIKFHLRVADAKTPLTLQIIHYMYILPEHIHQILVHLQNVYVAQTLEENGFRVSCSGKEASNHKMFENTIHQRKYMSIHLTTEVILPGFCVSQIHAPNYITELFLLECHCFKYCGFQ